MDKVLLICKTFNYNIDELMNENIKEVEENKESKRNINKYIEDFFEMHLADEELLDLLFSFLLDDYYDGSDCQMGAARIIAKMDRQLLKRKTTLLLQAQENEVYWKRPFPNNEHLDWI